MDASGPSELPQAIALRIGQLLLDPQWIHRRVEQVSYLDQQTIHRRISIDFDVPAFPDTDQPTFCLPLAQLAKRKLINFDLRDSENVALAMPTAEENERLSSALLLELARLFGGDLVDPVVEKHIPILITGGSESDKRLAWERIFQPQTSVGERLRQQPGFVAVADSLSRNFILYLPVTRSQIGQRKLIKLAFDAPRPTLQVSGPRARLGWVPVEDKFRVPLVGFCSSYHFELEAPAEMEVTEGNFRATRNGDTVEDPSTSSTRRAHFLLSHVDRSDGFVVVQLRARSRELLAGAALFSILNSATLLFVLLRLHEFRQDRGIDAIIATLLVLPGILISYISRPSEHEMLTDFLVDVRRVALTSGVVSFIAALVLFAGYSERTLHDIFIALFALAALASATLTATWLARQAT